MESFPFETLPTEIHAEVIGYFDELDRWIICMVSTSYRHLRPEPYLGTSVEINFIPWGYRYLLSIAVFNGYLSITQIMLKSNSPDHYLLEDAVCGGHIEVIEYLEKTECPYDPMYLVMAAADGGHLELFKRYWQLFCKSLSHMNERGHSHLANHEVNKVYYRVGKSGDMDIIRYLQDTNIDFAKDYTIHNLALGAASKENIQLLEWLRRECHIKNKAMGTLFHEAARKGCIKTVKYLVDLGCKLRPGVMGAAMSSGDMGLIDYLFEKRCPMDTNCCKFAASHGNLDALIKLRAAGCPWSKDTIIHAKKSGHKDIVQWAIENGCPQ